MHEGNAVHGCLQVRLRTPGIESSLLRRGNALVDASREPPLFASRAGEEGTALFMVTNGSTLPKTRQNKLSLVDEASGGNNKWGLEI